MSITITLPDKAEIMAGGCPVRVAGPGETWRKAKLGNYAKERGVYVHHAAGRILYVGKTTVGNHGTFGERLRREFRKNASQDSDLHRLLAAHAESVRSYFLSLGDLDAMIESRQVPLSPKRKALIMEQVLIGLYEPEGNRA